MKSLDAQSIASLAAKRSEGQKVDPAIVYSILDSVVKGHYKDFQSAMKPHNVSLHPSKLLKEPGFKFKVFKLLLSPTKSKPVCLR